MCASGKVKYVSSGAANLTANAEYDVVAVNAHSASEVGVVVVDDNTDLFVMSLQSADYQVTELYSSTKVI